MKKIIFLLTILCVSCEDVVTIDLPKADDQIVIDAELGRQQGGGMATLRVLVSKTTDFYSSDILSVDDASVSLLYDNEILLPIMLRMVYIHWIFPRSRLTNNIN